MEYVDGLEVVAFVAIILAALSAARWWSSTPRRERYISLPALAWLLNTFLYLLVVILIQMGELRAVVHVWSLIIRIQAALTLAWYFWIFRRTNGNH